MAMINANINIQQARYFITNIVNIGVLYKGLNHKIHIDFGSISTTGLLPVHSTGYFWIPE